MEIDCDGMGWDGMGWDGLVFPFPSDFLVTVVACCCGMDVDVVLDCWCCCADVVVVVDLDCNRVHFCKKRHPTMPTRK